MADGLASLHKKDWPERESATSIETLRMQGRLTQGSGLAIQSSAKLMSFAFSRTLVRSSGENGLKFVHEELPLQVSLGTYRSLRNSS